MKATAVLLALAALLMVVIPHYAGCRHEGRMLTLETGEQVPTRCHWTAQAEMALALPLLGMALTLGFSRRRGPRRSLPVVGALLGLAVIALPTVLIGTCSMSQSFCNLIMKPGLIVLGGLVTAANLAVLVIGHVQLNRALSAAAPAHTASPRSSRRASRSRGQGGGR